MAHEVKLEVFQGPIDLLLHLITRRRVDIYEVPLAAITDEARSELLEERDLLLARLVECATYREAGLWMAHRLRHGELFYARPEAGRDIEALGLKEAPTALARACEILAGTSPIALAAAAAQALAVPTERRPDTSHVAPITASVKDAIAHVAALLQTRSPASFAYLSGGG